MPHPFFDVPVPTVIGHRGAAGDAAQNTLPSFRLALEQGAHILETDVHASADGVAVVAHDPIVDAVTEARGAIADRSVAELQALDAGYRFTPDDGATFPMRGRGLVIPTLESVFAEFPDARFNIEVKASAAVDATVDAVARFDRADRTLLVAHETETMQAIRLEVVKRGIAPALGASLGDVLEFVASAQQGRAPASDSMALQIPPEFAGRPLITEPLLAHAHAHGIFVHAWTINDEDECTRLLDLGVDGLVTDFPARLVRLLIKRG